MRPADVLGRAEGYLARHGVDSPRATAEALLAHVLGTDRAGLYARTRGLSTAEASWFGRALCRRCAGTPLQHLTGEQGFRRLTLTVRPGVFVPRPETEVLVGHALTAIAGLAAPAVADVGTGSGAIALALADEHPGARVWATDLSPEAVFLARENARRLELAVEVLEGEGLAPLPRELEGALDLVVSNPPYVALEDYEDLPLEVRTEPVAALLGGIDVYERLATEAAAWLRPGGALAVEIEERRGPEVAAVLGRAGYRDVVVHPDLAGRERVVLGNRA